MVIDGRVSIVYNLKIAETTKHQASFEPAEEIPPITIALTPFNQFRNRYSHERINYAGSLFSAIYAANDYYVRADWAFADINSKSVNFKETRTDDLLFTTGYSYNFNQRARGSISGLFGVPTHKDLSAVELQFGYAHVGFGVQLDGTFLFSNDDPNYSFRCAARYIRFLGRSVHFSMGHYYYNIGNLIDLFVALHITAGKSSFEIGYNPTISCGASISPYLPNVVTKTNYKRNGFLGIYKYHIKRPNRRYVLALATSYSFDYEPRFYGHKRIVTSWALGSFSF